MKAIRKSNERGQADYGWLKANYTFSFASYFNPAWMGYRSLRVINDDFIDPKMGFDTHSHRDMEIISFILEGAMEHKDTIGSHTQIVSGEIQIMSAGTGIMHSEFNPSDTVTTHSLQIWIEPNQKNVAPRYDQYKYNKKENALTSLITPQGGDNIAKIHADMSLSLGAYSKGEYEVELDSSKYYWIQVVKGSGNLDDLSSEYGDGIQIENESLLKLSVKENFEFLLFELS